jgi:hypothetical protein
MNPITDKPNSLYPVGTRIISIHGETSDTEAAQDVFTGPNAQGVISQVLTDQEHCYSVDFPLGVSVFLSPSEMADSSKYKIDPMTLYTERIFAIVRVNLFNVEAANHLQAIEKAEEMVDLDALLTRGTSQEFAEDIDCYCLDEVGDEEFTNTRWYEKDGLTLMTQPAHSVSLVNLTSGDVGLILDGKFVLTADPNFEPTEQVTQASSNLAAILGVELNIIEIDPPSNDDWNWDNVLLLINNPVLEQKLLLSN